MIDWEENIFVNVAILDDLLHEYWNHRPDNSYLVFNAEGSILGKLSGSFVSNLRTGDVILLGGSTHRVTNIQGTRVNVTSVTGHDHHSLWSGEARSRRELSQALLDLIGHCIVALRREQDPRMLLWEVYGLSNEVANAIARHLEEHSIDSFQVPDSRRILVEQVISGAFPTYMITTCRGRGFNTALGYFMAGLAESNNVAVIEMSFDENGLLLKTSQEVDPGEMYRAFRENNHLMSLNATSSARKFLQSGSGKFPGAH